MPDLVSMYFMAFAAYKQKHIAYAYASNALHAGFTKLQQPGPQTLTTLCKPAKAQQQQQHHQSAAAAIRVHR